MAISACGMVDSISIENFRGFRQFQMDKLSLVNIVVGDNAVGKTSLLEAFYLCVSGNAQQPFHLRQWRGQEVKFNSASADSVADGIYSDLFHDADSDKPIIIKCLGRGFENRQLIISRSQNTIIANQAATNRHERRSAQKKKNVSRSITIEQTPLIYTVPILLTWIDQDGGRHETRVLMSSKGLEFEGTNERLPSCFFYASQASVSASEGASHLANLKKRRNAESFRRIFRSVFPEIREIDVGEVASSPVLQGDVSWSKELLPLSLISGATSRTAAILLSISAREDGLVLVDEIENGVFYARQPLYVSALLEMARAYKTQLVMSTHSEEWLRYFVATPDQSDDITFWRMYRANDGRPSIRRFSLEEFESGMAAGEMR